MSGSETGLGGWRAAVDIGSVAAKLLLTDGSRRIRHSVDTMLGGTGLSAIGEARAETMEPEALARLDEALSQFRELIAATVPGGSAGLPLSVVATSPGRWAGNAALLGEAVKRHLRAELVVVDGVTEARLAFEGAATDPGLASAGSEAPLVTIDIGGGSTELASGTVGGARHLYSLPIGGRSVTAAYLRADPPRPEELSAALSVVELHVDDVRREVPGLVADLGSATVFGLGAVVTVAAIEVGLGDGDPNCGAGDGPLHGVELSRQAVEEVFRTLATERRADRVHNPGLPPTRVDEIVGATAVLVEIMRQLGLEKLVVSQRGLLDGLIGNPPPITETITGRRN